MPKHSILYNAYNLVDKLDEIDHHLKEGIKVLWFGSDDDISVLSGNYPDHIKCRILGVFSTSCFEQFQIEDGHIGSNGVFFNVISQNRDFNSEQFLIEHSRSNNLIVEASAGTGKTSVMIDRILFLLDMVDNLDPSEISMVTFTNDATTQMDQKLQNVLMERYRITGNRRFLNLLEKQSQMGISTIHSFALKLIKYYGVRKGLSRDVGIESFRYDIDRIIDSILDEQIDVNRRVDEQFGLKLYDIRRLIHDYWDRLMQLGISDDEIRDMVWGKTSDLTSEVLQSAISFTIPAIIDEYRERKYQRNAVSLSDMVRDLDTMMPGSDDGGDVGIRYLFVDEFQDSDDSQINVIAKLCRIMGISLFAVGDIKQSIYRFRGADDSAFDTLKHVLSELGVSDVESYSLINNYRTSPDILDRLSPCFRSWSESELLRYDSDVCARRTDVKGAFEFNILSKYDPTEEMLVQTLNSSLDDLAAHVDPKGIRESDKVVVLTRTNSESLKVSDICKKNGIPVIVKQEGCFFTCDAVRDFHSLISSFVYPDPPHLFNYILTPYCPLDSLPDLYRMESFNGNGQYICHYLSGMISDTRWGEYRDMLSVNPTMYVVKRIMEEESVVDRYISRLKGGCQSKGWDDARTRDYVCSKAKQYEADLDKLIEVLQGVMVGEGSNPSILCDYLELMMQTNRDEECVDIDEDSNYSCVHCMTVHKAKGLEFDTVILPFTDWTFRMRSDSEILIDRESGRVGWKYKCDGGDILRNDNYGPMRTNENRIVKQEEARLLYVALTRPIRRLIVCVDESYKKNTWGELLMDGGML